MKISQSRRVARWLPLVAVFGAVAVAPACMKNKATRTVSTTPTDTTIAPAVQPAPVDSAAVQPAPADPVMQPAPVEPAPLAVTPLAPAASDASVGVMPMPQSATTGEGSAGALAANEASMAGAGLDASPRFTDKVPDVIAPTPAIPNNTATAPDLQLTTPPASTADVPAANSSDTTTTSPAITPMAPNAAVVTTAPSPGPMDVTTQSVSLDELTTAQVRDLQTALVHHGEALRIDGKLGPETKGAVAAFQTRSNRTASNMLDATTLTQLGLPQTDFFMAH